MIEETGLLRRPEVVCVLQAQCLFFLLRSVWSEFLQMKESTISGLHPEDFIGAADSRLE